MTHELSKRHFLKLLDFTPREIQFLLDFSAGLKKAKYAGTEQQCLSGKNIALIFEKESFSAPKILVSCSFSNIDCNLSGHFSDVEALLFSGCIAGFSLFFVRC